MGKLKEDKKKVKVKKTPKKIWILSKENFELTLLHSLVCRGDQKCNCVIKESGGKRISIPASIHVIKGVPVEVPEVLLREKGGVLVAKIKSKIAKQIEK